MRKLSGDTLVEVMFAVGIFSMIIVSSIAVMNSGTKNIQRDLEITMTRNEINTQAEALRFIQSSYAASRQYETNVYDALWQKIKSLAISLDDSNKKVVDFNPATCSELYADNGEVKKYGFVVNYRKMENWDESVFGKTANVNDVIKVAKKSDMKFQTTTLYPRLLFEDKNDTDGDQFYSQNEQSSYVLKSADGIYVIAVMDGSGAYYDFYIRSCWSSSDDGVPTITSTVIRLYDPDIER